MLTNGLSGSRSSESRCMYANTVKGCFSEHTAWPGSLFQQEESTTRKGHLLSIVSAGVSGCLWIPYREGSLRWTLFLDLFCGPQVRTSGYECTYQLRPVGLLQEAHQFLVVMSHLPLLRAGVVV